ncbi:HD domain-containing protein [Treponema primitia]|uniref:HD domain-containing phosphohydrolase n=1 Tax=Treponema primitia TaxID=88058 RepID=UPI00397F9AEE
MADTEDLEPLEVLETLSDDNLLDDNSDIIEPLKSSTTLFEESVFPVLIVNRQLRILYANPGSKKMFSSFQHLQKNNFIDVFGKSFDLKDIREIRSTVTNGENGYSWKGEARIKSRNMVTVQTKVYIFPAELNISAPKEFVVMFDDVTEENRQLLRSVFNSLLEASKLKDNDTGKHISRVNFYSRCLAEELHLKPGYERVDADFIDNIGLLASMHDVGKIGTPDDILNKEGPLSDWEWSVMQEHTKNGAFILSTYPNPMAKEIALSHHEKWNGSGYPFHLEGTMIPLAARIVAIADVYDALRMRRSYKPPIDHPTAINMMMKGKDTHFDPTLLDTFYTVSDKFNDLFEKNKDK